jgi:hypothetical protein
MIAARQIAFGGSAKEWENPYAEVSDITNLWDGEWNAGGGRHDASFVGLKDLVGTKDLMLLGNNLLLENGVDFQTTQRWQFDTDTIPTEDFAFKVVHDRTNTSGNTCVFGLGYSTARIFVATKSQIGYRFGTSYINADNSDAKTQVIYIRRNSNMSVYINGIKALESVAPLSPIGRTNIAINGENAYGNYMNRITINNMMIVSRAITEDEIAYLYNIDKVRFGL